MLTVWSNADLPESSLDRVRAGIAPGKLVLSSSRTGNLDSTGADPLLADADIAFGQPNPDQLLTPLKLKWVQLTSAGYTRYDRQDLRNFLKSRGTIMTNASSVFDEPCAEHIVAFMFAHARALPQSLQNQFGPRGWPLNELRPQSYLLMKQSVLLLGFGAIARRIVELLQPLRMNITAIRQTPRGDEPIPVRLISEVEKLLPTADHVINCLPASDGTKHFMTAARFAAMKPSAILYNIGRGTTVDQSALVSALVGKKLGGAYLDVTDPEPLPADHRLWTAPKCFITPHIGGGYNDEFNGVVDQFLANFRAFQSGSPLRDRII